MSFEQQGALLEQTYEHYVVLGLKYIIGALQLAIPFVTTFSKQNPTVFLLVVTTILLYITWKVLKNLFLILKRLVLLYLIILVVSVHLRGWDQFINSDVPYFYNTVATADNAYKFGQGVKFLLVQIKFYANYLYHYVENMQ
ncbi:hypothetical protein DAKH74_019710 [Maudiozyma humilis]|uniref:Uncharacterized protein n=1 Tax=Maudiozyma humilis TaxID=51915 RepID=A0AAV5RVA8_MAUHU|nr:hypothetical protein DAKH74_019710 [Kazachstania humilis]